MATSLRGWQLKPISLSPLACLLAWRVPTGSQRVPKGLQKGPPKWPKMDQKSTRAALGMPKGVRGYPPRCLRGSQHVFLCIFMHILRISMHIYAYFVNMYAYLCMFLLVLCIFMHIVVHVTHIYAYFMYIYTSSAIFMNVYVYLMHICKHLCFVRICVHIHTYLFMSRRWSAVNEESCSRTALHKELKYLQIHSI